MVLEPVAENNSRAQVYRRNQNGSQVASSKLSMGRDLFRKSWAGSSFANEDAPCLCGGQPPLAVG